MYQLPQQNVVMGTTYIFETSVHSWNWWRVVAQLVETLRYKLEGCGFQFDS